MQERVRSKRQEGDVYPRPGVDRGRPPAGWEASGRVVIGPELLAGDCIRGKEIPGSSGF